MAMQVTPGRYAGTIAGHKLAVSKNGNVMIAFEVEVVGKVDPENPEVTTGEGAGLRRTVLRTITEGTAQRLWDELDLLGYDGDDFDRLDRDKSGDRFIDLAGRPLHLRCTPDSYQGQERDRWEFDLFAGGGMNLNPADAQAVRQANAQFGRKAVGKKPAAAGPANRPATNPNPKAASGNKVPF